MLQAKMDGWMQMGMYVCEQSRKDEWKQTRMYVCEQAMDVIDVTI
jgi:hypothetical protein